jgi:hypothetical protein
MNALFAALFLSVLGFAAANGIGDPCGTSDCTYTQGYWKNHEEDWPVLSLKLGNIVYSQTQLLQIFNTPPAGKAILILAHQLIAALLNRNNGASASATVEKCITDAQNLLKPYTLIPAATLSTTLSATAVTLSTCLTNYNEGNAGVSHCDSRVVMHCNDNDKCTSDTCVDRKCVYTPIPNCCDCYSDCRDSNPCTVDKCGPDNRCIHDAIPGCII